MESLAFHRHRHRCQPDFKTGDPIMNFTRRHFLSVMASIGVFAMAGPAVAKKHEHHSGKDLLGDKIKANGKHVIHKKGPHTVSVDVMNGKIAGVSVKHDKKGNVAVKKY